ncbi:MAG TPA: ribonuclease J [Bacillales bacterium]|nr:ribonuclease J [Bacillales bacterium]
MARKKEADKVKVFALGGVGELGKNMYGVEVNGRIIVVDAGQMSPENDMLGVDVVIPDITYLTENRERVLGIFLTHGHEDHIGALPYLLKQLKVPVYGTRLTLELVKSKLADFGLLNQVKLRLIDPEEEVRTGNIRLSFFRVNHSIPDAIGIVIHTEHGAIVHTGDFNLDSASLDTEEADLRKMAEIGDRGVLCLLSDSTNADLPGVADSETGMDQEISEAFYKAKGRIIAACVASNIHAIQQVFDAAAENGRKMAVIGRSIEKVIHIARELGYLKIRDEQLVQPSAVKNMTDSETVLLTSGLQGEPIPALREMLHHNVKNVKIESKDTVVIADDPVVGNERTVSHTIDELVRIGAEVIYKRETHDSGHAFAEELKLMMRLMKPQYFMPVHGEYRLLKAHSKLARAVEIPEEHIFIAEKGEVIEFVNGEAGWGGKVPSGKVLVDGYGIGDVGNIVLRDRRLLSEDGILLVVVTLGRKTKKILSGPELISRGFVYVRESEQLLEEAGHIVSEVLESSLCKRISEWSSLKTGMRDALGRYLFDKTQRRPMILPIIMEV